MSRPELLWWITRNPLSVVALLATTVALLVSVVIARVHSWTGGGFNVSGPEMSWLREMLALRTGMTVADVGAGKGQLTLALARAVGPTGRVFSSEIDPARLRAPRKAAAEASPGH